MRLFKFLFYCSGLIIGITFAFCSNSDYEKDYQAQYPGIETPKERSDSNVDKNVNKLGKKLFKQNCAACHNKNMRDDMTGPALKGTTERWAGREELLYAWIRNSAQVIASGDPYSVALYNKYNKSVMTAFPNLTDDDIKALLEYIESVP